ncbi:MAG: cobalamin-dependent protein [Alphaproteobacteria bacterium]|nr:cobalamin-dependent protein [Alphaproteobacteria bacterium]
MSQAVEKVLFLNPPGKVWVYSDGTPSSRKHSMPPIGIAYIAANMRRHGYRAAIMDMQIEGYEHEVYEHPFIVYGSPFADVQARIEAEKPDMIGISAMFSMLFPQISELCAQIKQAFPGMPIVLGGYHVTGAPGETMKDPNIDYVVPFEAEENFVVFLNALNGKMPITDVPHLWWRDEDGGVQHNRSGAKPKAEGDGWSYFLRKDTGAPMDLDGLPFPAWDLVPLEQYWEKSVRIGGGDIMRARYLVMTSSRGCPHVCDFCSSPLISGYKGYRMRTVESVVAEVRWLVDTLGVEEIHFLDDNFHVGKDRVKELLRIFIRDFPDTYFCVSGGSEINLLDDETIDLMAEAKFYKVLLSVESGDPEVQQEKVDKKVKLDRAWEVIERFKKRGVEVRVLFMIGFPNETRAQIDRTVDMATSMDLDDFQLSIVTPMPGTPLFDYCKENDLFIENFSINDIRFSKPNLKLPDTTPDELENLRRTVWKESFEARRGRLLVEGGAERKKKFLKSEEYERVAFNSVTQSQAK